MNAARSKSVPMGGLTMKPLSFHLSVLLCIALVLVPWSRPQARPLCYGCGPAIAGTAVGLGAVIGIGVYLIHRSHTSLKGCVQQTDNGLSLLRKMALTMS